MIFKSHIGIPSSSPHIIKWVVLLLMFSHLKSSNIFSKAEERFAISTLDDCRKIIYQSDCNCLYRRNFDSYEITCPKNGQETNNATLQIEVPSHHNFVKLTCFNTLEQMPPLPDFDIGLINKVIMDDCPLEEEIDGSFAAIFTKLNLSNVEKLEYKSGDWSLNLTHRHLMHLQNLTHISLVLKDTIAIQDDMIFKDLNMLEELSLKTYQTKLPANFLDPLKNLKILELRLQVITELPADTFRFNQQLQKLSLLHSEITHLPKEFFANLTSLKTLNIFGNDIKTLEAHIFDDLTNLSAISLNSNRLEALPPDLFAYTKQLESFSLANNHGALRVLPSYFLAKLPLLKSVKLGCGLETIAADIFENSPLIENITIEGNRLSNVPENLFYQQKNLLQLDLSVNHLSEFPQNLFISNTKLMKLKLSNNRIEKLSGELFKPITSLEQLILDNNNIKLNASSINSPFDAFKNLKILNLCRNKIEQRFFENNFKQESLTELGLCHNNITAVDINKLKQISNKTLQINLANNRISTIIYEDDQNVTMDQTSNPSLYVNLEENPLNCDCQLLGFAKFLKRKGSKKVQLKSDFLICQEPANLKRRPLYKLSPEEFTCRFEDCPLGCECAKFTSNKTLHADCSNKNLTTMPDLSALFVDKQYSKWAIEINLANNKLTKLPNLSLPDFNQIVSLGLAGNELRSIALENFPQHLTQLDLRHNKFQTINNVIVGYFEKNIIKTIQLSGNPWICNCSTEPLLEFAHRSFNTIPDLHNMRCDLSGESVSILEVNVAGLCADDKVLIICLSIFMLLLVIFVIFAILFMIFNTEIKVWLYSHRMCLWLISKTEPDEDKTYDAFISYSSKDEQFVVEQLVPNLEKGDPSFKVCVHYRDFLVGEKISANIANSVENSRRTIIVLSKNFIQADWTLHEFRFAHLSALEEKQPRVIIILYGDIGEVDAIDPELQAYLKTKTYLEWKDPKFWDRLRYAMPHSRRTEGLILKPTENGHHNANGLVSV